MKTIKNFVQTLGFDGFWASILISTTVAFVLAGLSWVGICSIQKKLRKIPHNELNTKSSLMLSSLGRIKPTLVFLIIFLSVLCSASALSDEYIKYFQWIVLTLGVFQIGLLVDGILKPVFLQNSRINSSSIGDIGLFLSRLFLWIVLSLIVLDNFGVKITALIAGLGVGGIAIALAVKSLLEDILASLTIALDKPFARGDTITIGEFTGTVENIGIKTTHVRSISGELLVFPNNDLLQSRLRNFGRMRERRVLFMLGITYETPEQNIQKACKIVKDVIESQKNARFERAHFVHFNSSSLDIEVVYWVLSPDFKTHIELREKINLEIFSQFNNAGIEFAYPTQRTIGEGFIANEPKK